MNQNKEYLENKQDREPKANREHKSSMFTDLYMQDDGENERDIELYNALHEEQLPLMQICHCVICYIVGEYMSRLTKQRLDLNPFKSIAN